MTVYYAQSSANINAANVWNTAANGSGSYLSWPPASGDVLMANNKTITVNVDCNLGSTGQVRNDNANGATAGGNFELTDGVTVTANIHMGSTVACVRNNTTGTAYTVGTVTTAGGNATRALELSGNGTLAHTGNVYGGTGSGSGLGCSNTSASGTLSIVGTVFGGTQNAAAYGAVNNTTGTGVLSVNGPCIAGTAPAIGTGAGGTQVTLLSGPFLITSSAAAVCAISWRWLSGSGATYIDVPTQDLSENRRLYTADSVGGNPAASNVRYGTTYGPANELTGTAHIPAAASVLYGVPVDAATGTATISAADIRSALGLASANLDTQLGDLPTASENATAVWGAGTRTLTSASGITAQDVWEYATRTLTAGSGITAQDVWEYATREITGGTVTTLTNSPDVPTEAEIAAQVRVELTPELSRVANCATVESTGDQLAGLL